MKSAFPWTHYVAPADSVYIKLEMFALWLMPRALWNSISCTHTYIAVYTILYVLCALACVFKTLCALVYTFTVVFVLQCFFFSKILLLLLLVFIIIIIIVLLYILW